jgi:alanine racemase
MTTANNPDRAARASQSILTVDLGALAANYRMLRDRVVAGGACAAVVKADAYGVGVARAAPVLHQAGCTEFFVVHLDEGLTLRRMLPAAAHVYVLNGVFPGEEQELAQSSVIPALNDLAQVALWRETARNGGSRLPAILHIDTGMTRLGLSAREVAALTADPGLLTGIDVRYVISHLVASEETGHPLNPAQLSALKHWRTAFPHARFSLCNSSGIFLGPEYHFDLVRPGAALYGVNPTPDRSNPMRPVVRLEGKILQIHEVDPPKTVGYGATHRVTGHARIATITAGYADGWPRSLGNNGCAYIGDVRVPVIGRVSMDLTTLDVTTAPHVKPGDTVELLGNHLTVDDVADMAGTIGYEILTRLGPRYHRVYIGGA